MTGEFLDQLAAALALELPIAPRDILRPLPAAKPAAVLMLLAGDRHDPSILFTRRSETVDTHKGQIALPGGVRDPNDLDDHATALRETQEEVGIAPDRVRVAGQLPAFPTFTGFSVTTTVGLFQPWGIHVSEIKLTTSPQEIAEIFWAKLSDLADPAIYREELLTRGGVTYVTHNYQFGPHRIWGVTGLIVKNLLDRLHSVELG